MSVKVPEETVGYQCHTFCQCDFCTSRRGANAKKWAVSQRVAELQHAQQQNGCCCGCHDALNAGTFAKSRNATTFDPNYPAPVNQTALNASRGRTGNGTVKGATTGVSDAKNATMGGVGETPEEAMADLDRLERLLVLEHKARVQAALEAGQLASLRATGKAPEPQSLPADYTAMGQSYNVTATSPDGLNDSRDGVNGDSWQSPATIHDAYVAAHVCPITPPPQCHASHQLQDTLNTVRLVTRDPVNTTNRSTLNRVLEQGGAAAAQSSPGQSPSAVAGGNATAMGLSGTARGGPSLAELRTSKVHPQGAGLVWVKNGDPRLTGTYATTASQLAAPPVMGGTTYGVTANRTAPVPALSPGAVAAMSAAQGGPLGQTATMRV